MAGKTSGTSSSSASSSSEDGGSGDGRVLVVRVRHPVGRGVRMRREMDATELTQVLVVDVVVKTGRIARQTAVEEPRGTLSEICREKDGCKRTSWWK